MSCNFCKNINPQGMTQYCRIDKKEVVYDRSTDCADYQPKDDAPAWVHTSNVAMRITMTLNFGKYKGQTIDSVMQTDPAYIGWALGKGLVGGLDDLTKAAAIQAKELSDEPCDWALQNGYF